ncbi:unnamed protein product [Rotaria sp. Silwood2]|nr:unnamed protein product [Rotaria sp. Silwood2]CAF4431291.1 unnamed protein product [Rotaria sp. Silwood2]
MSSTQSNQQQNNDNNNNNNNVYGQLILLLDVNQNGRLVLPFSRRLILIDRPFENVSENDNDEQNETSVDDYNTESEFSSSLSENYFLTDDENNDGNSEDNGSFVSISLPPTPFPYDPYDSYDSADEYEQNYVEHVPQNTPVEKMDVEKSFQQQDVSMKQIGNSKQYQQHLYIEILNMNMNTETILKTPSQDAQGGWYDLLSPTQVCTGKEKNLGSMNIHLNNDFMREDEEEATMNVDDDNLFNNQSEQVPIKYHSKSLEEQALSQRLSQLSMISHHTPEHLIMVNKDDAENIPYYLSKESKSFQEITSDLPSYELVEELRQMAMVIHQLFMIDLEKSLWTPYLKSGTDQLQLNQMDNDNLIHTHLWPIEVQKLVSKQSPDNTDTAACLTYVTQHLDELDDKMKQYQTKYNMKKNQYFNYVPKIQIFVHQQLESARLATEQQIAIVHYNFNDHLFELKFMTYNPTPQQIKIIFFKIFNLLTYIVFFCFRNKVCKH